MRSAKAIIIEFCLFAFITLIACPASSDDADQGSTKGIALGDSTVAYVGTYTGAQSKGIYLYRLLTQNLEVSQNVTLEPLGLAAETSNPSFLELDPNAPLVVRGE